MAATIGPNGLDAGAFADGLKHAERALETVRGWYQQRSLPLLHVHEHSDDIHECAAAVDRLSRNTSDLVIFATGGSSLGAQVLCQLAGYRLPGIDATGRGAKPRLHFFDNLDSDTLDQALRRLELKTTRFLIISKSGATAETVVQTLVTIEALRQAGLDWNLANHMTVLTAPAPADKNPLRMLALRFGLPVLDCDPGIGGRYSVLSNTGLLPAMVLGIDAMAVRAGAGTVIEAMVNAQNAESFAPALGAALHHGFARRLNAVIMMPYSDRLRLFSTWFQQLWAESLGKHGHGTQPVAAVGPFDQHSQLQLFLDGPADKLLTVIAVDGARQDLRIPDGYRGDHLIGYLAGRSVGDVVDCQARATMDTHATLGRPTRAIWLERLDERTLGALLMHFMLETVFTGLMCASDPFDQPAVEQSKTLTRTILAGM